MNKQPMPAAGTGLILLILALASGLALRETYAGKTQWQFVQLITCPLLLYYMYKNNQESRQKKDADNR